MCIPHNPKYSSTDNCILKVMTSHENYVNATRPAFTILPSEEQLGKAVFAEMAMTCLTNAAGSCQWKEHKPPCALHGGLH